MNNFLWEDRAIGAYICKCKLCLLGRKTWHLLRSISFFLSLKKKWINANYCQMIICRLPTHPSLLLKLWFCLLVSYCKGLSAFNLEIDFSFLSLSPLLFPPRNVISLLSTVCIFLCKNAISFVTELLLPEEKRTC